MCAIGKKALPVVFGTSYFILQNCHLFNVYLLYTVLLIILNRSFKENLFDSDQVRPSGNLRQYLDLLNTNNKAHLLKLLMR
jgi:hypothetical protein